MKYIESILNKKETLDVLIKKYQCQPVWTGYIDIISSKENILDFIDELSINWFLIYWVTWWYHCKSMDECPLIWMWWAKSIFYSWWFAEIGYWDFVYDNTEIKMLENINILKGQLKNNNKFKKIIKRQQIFSTSYNFTLSFDDTNLAPAIWLLVPTNWKNLIR